MPGRQLTCDANQFEHLLQGTLADTQRESLEAHLEHCAYCRDTLDRLAAEEFVWDGVCASLREDDISTPGTRSQSGCELVRADRDAVDQVQSLLSPSDDPQSLGRLGTYEVRGVIGSGGMGVVLKALDPALDRIVAIKALAPTAAHSAAARLRFSREAQAAAAVLHDNVIDIHGVAESNGLPYFVMPYVKGPSLQKRLDEQGPFRLVEILRIGMQAAAGLAAAHAQGLVHRDVKPANILLADGVERVKLTDFGLARAADDVSLTKTGYIAGTPLYMSPEQALGESVGQSSDVFSLGAVLYTMSTGVAPFRAETTYGVLRRIIDDSPRPIRELNPDIPEWFERIVFRMMSREPAYRPESAEAVARLLKDALAHVQDPRVVALPAELRQPDSISRKSVKPSVRQYFGRPVVTVLTAVMLLVAGGFAFRSSTSPPVISGDWQTQDGRLLTLTELSSGRYRGVVGRADGMDLGDMELDWSRWRQQFQGAWSRDSGSADMIEMTLESETLIGRLVERDVSNADHPKQDGRQFVWTRTVTLPPNQLKSASGAEFETTVQTVIPFGAPCARKYFRFRDEQVFEIGYGPGDSSDHAEEWSKIDSTGGVDGLCLGGPNGLQFAGQGMVFVSEPEADWTTILPADVARALRTATWIDGVMEVSAEDLPITRIFRTANGDRGVLQLLEIVEDDRGFNGLGIRIQYRLLRAERKESDAPEAPIEPPPMSLSLVRSIETHYAGRAVCSADGTLVAVANRQPTMVMRGAGGGVPSDSWAPGVQILDVKTGQPVCELTIMTEDEEDIVRNTAYVTHSTVTAMSFSPDAKQLAVGNSIGQVELFNAGSGQLVTRLDDESPRIADTQTPPQWQSLQRVMGAIRGIAFSPDGSRIAACGDSFEEYSDVFDGTHSLGRRVSGPGRVKVFDLTDGRKLYDLDALRHATSLQFSSNGTRLVASGRWETASSHGSGVLIWNALEGTVLKSISDRNNGGTHGVVISPDGQLIAMTSVSFDKNKDKDAATGAITVLRTESGIVEWRRTFPGWIDPAMFSADSRILVIRHDQGRMNFLNVASGEQVAPGQFPAVDARESWEDAAGDPQGKHLVALSRRKPQGGTIFIWKWSAEEAR